MRDGDLSFEPIDILVVDYLSLLHSNGDPIFSRIRLLPELYQSFDVKVWRESSFRTRFRKNSLIKDYEFDFVEIMNTHIRGLRNYLKFHRTAILTSRRAILGLLGCWAFNCFDSYSLILQKYDLEVRARLKAKK